MTIDDALRDFMSSTMDTYLTRVQSAYPPTHLDTADVFNGVGGRALLHLRWVGLLAVPLFVPRYRPCNPPPPPSYHHHHHDCHHHTTTTTAAAPSPPPSQHHHPTTTTTNLTGCSRVSPSARTILSSHPSISKLLYKTSHQSKLRM